MCNVSLSMPSTPSSQVSYPPISLSCPPPPILYISFYNFPFTTPIFHENTPPLSVSPLLWLANLPHIFFRITPTLLYLLISFPLSLPLISHFYLSHPFPSLTSPTYPYPTPIILRLPHQPLFQYLTLKLPLPQNTHTCCKYVWLSFFVKSMFYLLKFWLLWLHCVSVYLETFSCQLDLTWSQGKDSISICWVL